MTAPHQPVRGYHRLLPPLAVLVLAVGVVLFPASTPAARAAGTPVGLGRAGTYSVLAGQAVTNTGPSTLDGDLGVSPGTAITGFPPGLAAGTTNAGNAAALGAQSDLVLAYNDAAGRPTTGSVAGDLGGQTLVEGVYTASSSIGLTGTLTLDAAGDPDSVWIFQVGSTLTTASASAVALVNGAQACNVFWQVGSSATLGTNSSFTGTIMALTSITVTTGTAVAGRALARNGQVSLDNNVFTTPDCDAPTTTTTTTTTTSATTTTTAGETTTSTSTQPSTTTSPTTTPVLSPVPEGGASSGEIPGQPSGGPGPSDLAVTGVSAGLGALVGLGVLLVALGGLLLGVRRTRRPHPPK
ncbi:ice-binding family protein [Actinokineospora sp. NBRC 105648]|uniref:ice-binding family protein n=1 Tax=Actinokineospora sp. NBRC 105648 TaxID=3032206 RepID=UPI002555A3D4|nr:ice-binding family protein [Actinokineospora sp. NBRC 105648]